MAWTGTVETLESISGSISDKKDISGNLSGTSTVTGSLNVPKSIGTKNYNQLDNKPKIEGNELIGDKTYGELGLGDITPQDIDEIIFGGNNG